MNTNTVTARATSAAANSTLITRSRRRHRASSSSGECFRGPRPGFRAAEDTAGAGSCTGVPGFTGSFSMSARQSGQNT